MAAEVRVAPPMRVPTGVNQDGLRYQIEVLKCRGGNSPRGGVNDDAVQVGDRLQGEFREVFASGVTVERAVKIRARVRYHFDLANVKLGSAGIVTPRLFP